MEKNRKKRVVVLTGAGISQESGIKTFRDMDGLWENFDVMEVASPQGWAKNKEMVLKFYNERRLQCGQTKPNLGHLALADLEKDFEICIITQNVDDLHEKAGSTQIMHIHGLLNQVRSTFDPTLVYDWAYDKPLNIGDKCEKGSQLRPHIVWFGESVPLIQNAAVLASEADIFAVIGTSMAVYPAAGLIDYVGNDIPKFIIDPNIPDIKKYKNLHKIAEKASIGVPQFAEILRKEYL